MSKDIIVKRLPQGGSIGICGYHSFSIIGIALTTGSRYTISSEGSLDTQVTVIHLILLSLMLVYVLTIGKTKLLSKVTAALVSLSAICVYVWWYLEKFSFLRVVYGLSIESPEYKEWLSEMSFFRGGSQLELFVAVLTGVLFFYSVFRLFQHLTQRKAYLA